MVSHVADMFPNIGHNPANCPMFGGVVISLARLKARPSLTYGDGGQSFPAMPQSAQVPLPTHLVVFVDVAVASRGTALYTASKEPREPGRQSHSEAQRIPRAVLLPLAQDIRPRVSLDQRVSYHRRLASSLPYNPTVPQCSRKLIGCTPVDKRNVTPSRCKVSAIASLIYIGMLSFSQEAVTRQG